MEATRRQRVLRAISLMGIGMLGALALSLDPARALRDPAFLLMTVGMCGWTIAENLVLRRDEPQDYAAKRNTRLLQVVMMLAIFLGVVDLYHVTMPFTNDAVVTPIGAAVLAGGAVLRIAAIRALDKHFTYELRVESGQSVVERGPYKLLRHPSYLGLLLICVGAALTLASVAAALLAGGLMFALLARRIRDEEQVLRSSFGADYERYAKRTWRLVPFVY